MPDEIDATIASMRPTYLARRREDLPLIDAALQAADLRTAAKIGHKLAGSAASYGFHDLTSLGRELEAACIEKRLDDARALAVDLADAIAALERSLPNSAA